MKHEELKKLLGEFEEKYLIIYNELLAKNAKFIASNDLKIKLLSEEQLHNIKEHLVETEKNRPSSFKSRNHEIKQALLKLDQEKDNLALKKDALLDCNQFMKVYFSLWKEDKSLVGDKIKGFFFLAIKRIDEVSQLYINQRDYLEAFRDIVYALGNLCIRAITIGYVPQFFDTTTKPMDRIKREVKAIETALERYVEKTEEQIKSLGNGSPSLPSNGTS